MTRREDVSFAAELGVDAVGVICYPGSPRYINLTAAKHLLEDFHVFMDVVAVMVNPDPSEVQAVLEALPVQYLQFHGDESPEFCSQFKIPYIKSVAAGSAMAIEDMARLHPRAAAVIVDTPSAARGGSGQCFDWQVLPAKCSRPLILAGGLNPDNICQALQHQGLSGVDVSSGIEHSPGIKDHAKMKKFIEAVRGARHGS